MTTIDKAVKEWKARVKESLTVLNGLEGKAAEFVSMADNRHDAETAYETASAELASVSYEKEAARNQLDEAVRFNDPRTERLREEYTELTDREQALMDTMGDATQAIEQNTPDDATVAELTTRLKRFHSPSVDEVVKAIQRDAESHAQGIRDRVTATVAQLPTPDPRTTHAALMELDEGYRKNDGASLENYLADEDEAGRSEQATAMLASRLEARDRRAVIAARR